MPRINAQVISDEPGFVYRANLRTPRLLNDPSVKRIDQHLLTVPMIASALRDQAVCAVVVWSPRFGRDLPGLCAAHAVGDREEGWGDHERVFIGAALAPNVTDAYLFDHAKGHWRSLTPRSGIRCRRCGSCRPP